MAVGQALPDGAQREGRLTSLELRQAEPDRRHGARLRWIVKPRADVAEAADLLDQPRQTVETDQKQHQITEDGEDVACLDGWEMAGSKQHGDDRAQNEAFHQAEIDGLGVGKFDSPPGDFVEVISDVDLVLRMDHVDFPLEFVVQASTQASCQTRIVLTQ